MKGNNEQRGTGILIIFIAMVTISAVTALVLLNASDSFSDKHKTGNHESSLVVGSIEGIQTNISDNVIVLLKIQVRLGNVSLDLNQVVIKITDGVTVSNLTYTEYTDANDKLFTAKKIWDKDSSFSQDNPVMNSGDIANIYISTEISPGTDVEIQLIPNSGAITSVFFQTPDLYEEKKVFFLYP